MSWDVMFFAANGPPPKMANMRFVIIGTSGSGKSTFARAMAEATRSTYIELDNLHWGENWTPRPREVFAESVRRATAGDRWVADGNYSAVREVLWPRATHVVWLNFSRAVVFSRIIWRTMLRVVRRDRLWQGNRESLGKAILSRDSILLWSFTTFAKNRVKYTQLRRDPNYSHLEWSEFRKPAEAKAFLASFGRARAPAL